MTTTTTKRTIFLVDDHPLVREWLTHLINAESDLVVCGDSPDISTALDKISASRPDLAVIDISLKDESGLDLIKTLRQRYSDLSMIVLSMHEESIYIERALRAGAKGYVVKRETSDQITAAIRKVLDGGIYISENLAAGLAEILIRNAGNGEENAISLLSARELEIFRQLGQGKKTAQIAEQMHISLKTVHTYCARMKEKLHLSNSTELMREAVCWYEEERKASRT